MRSNGLLKWLMVPVALLVLFVAIRLFSGGSSSAPPAADAGAKRLLLPMASVGDIPTIPGELFAKFQTSFYADPKDAVFKALGVQ